VVFDTAGDAELQAGPVCTNADMTFDVEPERGNRTIRLRLKDREQALEKTHEENRSGAVAGRTRTLSGS
jgi:hypothetical protein